MFHCSSIPLPPSSLQKSGCHPGDPRLRRAVQRKMGQQNLATDHLNPLSKQLKYQTFCIN
ncbi:hypothetical protein DPMN_085862 [Dreissena polymorpha]|uniref:Uncharacterized protein n=1 Tax=Dreissena polymorpha TaxID=45954 RepID=A0A9D3YDG2_DREPO|nr:hypothetical protein DPMN_085862 [Dreissena polymorpha]